MGRLRVTAQELKVAVRWLQDLDLFPCIKGSSLTDACSGWQCQQPVHACYLQGGRALESRAVAQETTRQGGSLGGVAISAPQKSQGSQQLPIQAGSSVSAPPGMPTPVGSLSNVPASPGRPSLDEQVSCLNLALTLRIHLANFDPFKTSFFPWYLPPVSLEFLSILGPK